MESLENTECVSETLRRIRTLSPESPRRWGRMTVAQMVCHLTDGFQMATGARPVAESSSLVGRTVMKFVALYVPARWPKGVPTLPEVDALQQGTPPTQFESDLGRVEQSFQDFIECARAGRCGRHPFFGALSPHQWFRWGYLHADHHLRQFGA